MDGRRQVVHLGGAKLPQGHHGEMGHLRRGFLLPFCTEETRAGRPGSSSSPVPRAVEFASWVAATPARIQELEILWIPAERGCQNSKCQPLPQIDSCYLPVQSRSVNNSAGPLPRSAERLAAPSISRPVATSGERRENNCACILARFCQQAEKPFWVGSCWAFLNDGQGKQQTLPMGSWDHEGSPE